MDESLKIMQFVSLFLLLLVTGVFWGTWFALSRSIEKFTPESFLAIGRVMIANLARPMRILMPLTIVCMISNLFLYPSGGSPGWTMNAFAVALIILSLLITVLIEVPIDNQIKKWTLATLPVNWAALRAKWQLYHTFRTFTSLISFLLLLASILF